MSNLYELIKKRCAVKKITLTELARKTGLSVSTFSDLKRGKSKSLSLDALVLIADYFNITLDELVGRKKEAPDAETSEAMGRVIDAFNQMTPEQQELFVQLVEQFLLQSSK